MFKAKKPIKAKWVESIHEIIPANMPKEGILLILDENNTFLVVCSTSEISNDLAGLASPHHITINSYATFLYDRGMDPNVTLRIILRGAGYTLCLDEA